MDPTKAFQKGRAMRRQNARKAMILVVKWHQAQVALLLQLLGDDVDGRGPAPPSRHTNIPETLRSQYPVSSKDTHKLS